MGEVAEPLFGDPDDSDDGLMHAESDDDGGELMPGAGDSGSEDDVAMLPVQRDSPEPLFEAEDEEEPVLYEGPDAEEPELFEGPDTDEPELYCGPEVDEQELCEGRDAGETLFMEPESPAYEAEAGEFSESEDQAPGPEPPAPPAHAPEPVPVPPPPPRARPPEVPRGAVIRERLAEAGLGSVLRTRADRVPMSDDRLVQNAIEQVASAALAAAMLTPRQGGNAASAGADRHGVLNAVCSVAPYHPLHAIGNLWSVARGDAPLRSSMVDLTVELVQRARPSEIASIPYMVPAYDFANHHVAEAGEYPSPVDPSRVIVIPECAAGRKCVFQEHILRAVENQSGLPATGVAMRAFLPKPVQQALYAGAPIPESFRTSVCIFCIPFKLQEAEVAFSGMRLAGGPNHLSHPVQTVSMDESDGWVVSALQHPDQYSVVRTHPILRLDTRTMVLRSTRVPVPSRHGGAPPSMRVVRWIDLGDCMSVAASFDNRATWWSDLPAANRESLRKPDVPMHRKNGARGSRPVTTATPGSLATQWATTEDTRTAVRAFDVRALGSRVSGDPWVWARRALPLEAAYAVDSETGRRWKSLFVDERLLCASLFPTQRRSVVAYVLGAVTPNMGGAVPENRLLLYWWFVLLGCWGANPKGLVTRVQKRIELLRGWAGATFAPEGPTRDYLISTLRRKGAVALLAGTMILELIDASPPLRRRFYPCESQTLREQVLLLADLFREGLDQPDTVRPPRTLGNEVVDSCAATSRHIPLLRSCTGKVDQFEQFAERARVIATPTAVFLSTVASECVHLACACVYAFGSRAVVRHLRAIGPVSVIGALVNLVYAVAIWSALRREGVVDGTPSGTDLLSLCLAHAGWGEGRAVSGAVYLKRLAALDKKGPEAFWGISLFLRRRLRVHVLVLPREVGLAQEDALLAEYGHVLSDREGCLLVCTRCRFPHTLVCGRKPLDALPKAKNKLDRLKEGHDKVCIPFAFCFSHSQVSIDTVTDQLVCNAKNNRCPTAMQFISLLRIVYLVWGPRCTAYVLCPVCAHPMMQDVAKYGYTADARGCVRCDCRKRARGEDTVVAEAAPKRTAAAAAVPAARPVPVEQKRARPAKKAAK
jgi:hypothetical protein